MSFPSADSSLSIMNVLSPAESHTPLFFTSSAASCNSSFSTSSGFIDGGFEDSEGVSDIGSGTVPEVSFCDGSSRVGSSIVAIGSAFAESPLVNAPHDAAAKQGDANSSKRNDPMAIPLKPIFDFLPHITFPPSSLCLRPKRYIPRQRRQPLPILLHSLPCRQKVRSFRHHPGL